MQIKYKELSGLSILKYGGGKKDQVYIKQVNDF